MEGVGNKAEVVRMLLDVVTYIEEEQNSEDMKIVKGMLLRITSTILNGLSGQIQPTQNTHGTTCTKPNCECGHGCNGHSNNGPTEPTSNNILPDVDINETIEKIRAEIRNEED